MPHARNRKGDQHAPAEVDRVAVSLAIPRDPPQQKSALEQHPPLDTEAAARQLGLSPRTLEKMRVYGGGPVYEKNGRRVLYDIDDLLAWRQRNKRFSTSDQGPGQRP